MEKRISKDMYLMSVALLTAKRSTCVSKQIGAVLVSEDGRVVMTGYNGVSKGKPHCNERYDPNNFDRERHHEWSLKNELHCEENILSYCAKNGIKTENTTMYITMSPCTSCARLLIASGIKKVLYVEEYDKDKYGIMVLNTNGVRCEQWK